MTDKHLWKDLEVGSTVETTVKNGEVWVMKKSDDDHGVLLSQSGPRIIGVSVFPEGQLFTYQEEKARD